MSEPLAQKPDSLLVERLLSTKYLKSKLNNTFSLDQLFIIFYEQDYVSFLPLFREAFTLEAVPKENRQWF